MNQRKTIVWDSTSWLARFEEAKKIRNTRPVRAEVFKSTVASVKEGRYTTEGGKVVELGEYLNRDAAADNMFYSEELPRVVADRRYDTAVNVVLSDCLVFAHTLREQDAADDLCVLNLASGSNPGGGVRGGSGAQEEYLFRCSDYYRFLFQYASKFSAKPYGVEPNTEHSYPLDWNYGGVFSHGVTVFRDCESKGYAFVDVPWRFNAVAVPAVNIKRHPLSPEANMTTMMNKMRSIFRIAYANGQRRLVLGAFGCGAFGQHPAQVAMLFRRVMNEEEFRDIFREIYFAIIEDRNSVNGNYTTFKQVFDN